GARVLARISHAHAPPCTSASAMRAAERGGNCRPIHAATRITAEIANALPMIRRLARARASLPTGLSISVVIAASGLGSRSLRTQCKACLSVCKACFSGAGACWAGQHHAPGHVGLPRGMHAPKLLPWSPLRLEPPPDPAHHLAVPEQRVGGLQDPVVL